MDHWQNVEYEGLHIICANCGIYGHVESNCTHTSRTPSSSETAPRMPSAEASSSLNVPSVVHGDWLIVQRRKQSPSGKKGKPGVGPVAKNVGGSSVAPVTIPQPSVKIDVSVPLHGNTTRHHVTIKKQRFLVSNPNFFVVDHSLPARNSQEKYKYGPQHPVTVSDHKSLLNASILEKANKFNVLMDEIINDDMLVIDVSNENEGFVSDGSHGRLPD